MDDPSAIRGKRCDRALRGSGRPRGRTLVVAALTTPAVFIGLGDFGLGILLMSCV